MRLTWRTMLWAFLIALAILIAVDWAHGQTIPATKLRFTPITAPTSVPLNANDFFLDSATGQLKCLNNLLASCLPAGGGSVDQTANYTWTGTHTFKKSNAVRFADGFAGADAGAKVAAAIADLPATGGTVDARGFEGTQTSATTITVDKPVNILFGHAAWNFSAATAWQVNTNGFRLIGAGNKCNMVNGTHLRYSGTTNFVQLGTDNGHAYDVGDYDGVQGSTFENLCIEFTGSGTALANGKGNYGAGRYGIRDWRGGAVFLSNLSIRNFEYGFWGIQSDLNTWTNMHLQYNKVGAFIGPRSDQLRIIGGYSFSNDTVLQIDGAWNAQINWSSDSDGSTTTPPFKLMGTYTRGTSDIAFNDSWFENYSGPAAAIESFVEIGVGATTKVTNVTFKDPLILSNIGTTPRTDYLAEIDNGDSIYVYRPKDRGDNTSLSLTSLLEFTGSTSQTRIVVERSRHSFTLATNNGTGTQAISQYEFSNSNTVTGRMNLTGALDITTEGIQAPPLTLRDSDNTSAVAAFRWDDAGTVAALKIDPQPSPTTDGAEVHLFRSTNSSGTRRLVIFQGDNTATEKLTFNAGTGVLTTTSFVGALTGNASTATALAADGTNCPPGNYPLGVDASGNVQTCTAASGGGTVTDFSAGDLSPLFTTTEATTTTTPALSFGLSNAAANTVFANCTGSLGAPSYCTLTDAMVPDSITISLAAAATALAANPADCAANQFAQTIAASGALGCAAIADADVPNNITISLAAAATALAANGTNCASTEAAIGVDASGNAEGCWTPGGGGGAVASGHYLTTVADANTNEVVITPGEGMERRINETDTNGGPYTLDFDPNDPTYFWVREEFCGGLTTTGNVGDNGWSFTTIVAAPTISMQATALPNPCSVRIASGATSGNGGSLSNTNIQALSNLGGNTAWEAIFIFRLNATTTESVRVGLVAALNAIEPTGGIWVRFDTNLADAAFKVETRSASTSTVGGTTYTVDTNFHKIRMRSTTAGTVVFTFDNNADQTISTNVPTVALVPAIVVATRAASARNIDLDFFSFKMRGLAR